MSNRLNFLGARQSGTPSGAASQAVARSGMTPSGATSQVVAQSGMTPSGATSQAVARSGMTSSGAERAPRERVFRLFCAGLALVGAFATSGCSYIADYTPGFIAKYVPTIAEAKAQAMVERAVSLHQSAGAAAAVREVQTGERFIDGEFYVFVVRTTDYKVIANPAFPEIVGANLATTKEPGGGGTLKHLVDDATVAGSWVRWRFRNPVTREVQSKNGWMVRIDNLVYGAGAYE